MAQKVQDLLVWQKSMEVAVAVYRLTQHFPQQEIYGLTSQLRRAAVSVASNIAEGRGRLTEGEFRNLLGIAQGSVYEVETQLILARQLGYGPAEEIAVCEGLNREVSKMLGALLSTLQRKS